MRRESMTRRMVEALVMALTVMLAIGVVMAKGDPAKGKASFDQMCGSCHGASGKGDGAAAAALNPKPRDLTDKKYVSGLNDDYLTKLIKGGGAAVGKSPLMPPMGSALKDTDIENLIAYVRSLGK